MYLNYHKWKSSTPPEGVQEEVPDIYLKLTANSGGEENGILVEDIPDIENVV